MHEFVRMVFLASLREDLLDLECNIRDGLNTSSVWGLHDSKRKKGRCLATAPLGLTRVVGPD
jgi:hypothetical protein